MFLQDTIPKEIFAILHEMGHALNQKDEIDSFDYSVKTSGLKGPHVLNEARSEEERKAWANALRLVRRLKTESGINVLEPFGSFEETQKFIHANLSNYCYYGELMFEKNSAKKWFKAWFGKLLSAEYAKFMEELFDKGKLRRKYGGRK